MQKNHPSHYFGARPIPEIKTRIKSLDRRYSRVCRFFNKIQKPDYEKQQKFVNVACKIQGEIGMLGAEIDQTSKVLDEMKAKRDMFRQYLASGHEERLKVRGKFIETHGHAPEHALYEYYVLSDEITRISGEKQTMQKLFPFLKIK